MLAVASEMDVDSDVLLRIATPFCSGMARTSGMCGAVTGGVMAIGLSLGREDPEASTGPSYEATQRFLEEFVERFGSSNCTELTGCDLSTPEGRAAYPDSSSRALCSEFVRWAAEAAERAQCRRS